MTQTIYVAVRKETQNVMSGAHGQYAYDNTSTLGRSIAQAYKYEAQRKGVKASELYDVIEVDVAELISQQSNKGEIA